MNSFTFGKSRLEIVLDDILNQEEKKIRHKVNSILDKYLRRLKSIKDLKSNKCYFAELLKDNVKEIIEKHKFNNKLKTYIYNFIDTKFKLFIREINETAI